MAIFTPASIARERQARQTFTVSSDVALDAAVSQPILPRAEHHTDDWRSHALRHTNGQREVFLRGTPLWLERLGGRTDAPRADVQVDLFSRACAFTAARYGASNDSKASRSVMNSESASIDAA